MWTEIAQEQYRREDLLYASDMTDAERALILPHPPGKKALGRPRVVPLRGVIEADIQDRDGAGFYPLPLPMAAPRLRPSRGRAFADGA